LFGGDYYRGADVGFLLSRGSRMDVMRILLVFLTLSAPLGCAGDPSRGDLERLQGKWKIVSYIENGKETRAEDVWEFAGDKLLYLPDSSVYSIVKLDAAQKPKRIEFDTITQKPAKVEKGFIGIYEFDADTVKFCIAKPGKESPNTFDSRAGSGLIITILRRVKDNE